MLGQNIQEILVRIHSQILLEFILEMHETNLLITEVFNPQKVSM